jgi:hypothetical protein
VHGRTKIGQFQAPFFVNQNVFRFNIPMHDMPLMHEGNPRGNLLQMLVTTIFGHLVAMLREIFRVFASFGEFQNQIHVLRVLEIATHT